MPEKRLKKFIKSPLPQTYCTGCGTCVAVCSQHAIRMVSDEEGFLYPCIDRDTCVDCGMCAGQCPICQKADRDYHCGPIPELYAAWATDTEKRASGSSGGIFSILAEDVLERDGFVAGAVFTSDHTAEHRIARCKEELSLLKKSKYLQSRVDGIYLELAELLKEGKPLMFVGTPCQCAALRAFLDREYENLLLCDFVCHGVGSPMVHQRYIRELEMRLGGTITGIDHRDKTYGWSDYQFSVECGEEKHLLGGRHENPYLRGYLANLYLRPSCYSCGFKGWTRPVDLTLGDCWGRGDSREGVSLLLAHTERALQWLNRCRGGLMLFHQGAEAIEANPCIFCSSADKYGRDAFFACLKHIGTFEECIIHMLGGYTHGQHGQN